MDTVKHAARAIAPLLVLFATTALAEPPGGPFFTELGHTVDSFQQAGVGQFAKADVDGDGLDDLVFGGMSGSEILFVVGKKSDGTLGFKQSEVVPDIDGYARIIAWPDGGQTRIMTVSTGGTVRIYGGWPLTEQEHFGVASDAVSAALGDVDADGNDDLLVLTQDHLYAYAMADGSAEWNVAVSGGSDLALAQLDVDPALEIIIAGPVPGLVLDGATRAHDWEYVDGFGAHLATGVFATGGMTQWIGAQAWSSFTVFGSTPYSPLWSFATAQDIAAVAAGDIDGHGADVILYGDGQWGQLHVVDPSTRHERFQIDNGGYSFNAIVVGSLLDAAHANIAYANESASRYGETLVAADARSGAKTWVFNSADGPVMATAIGDVDGDGDEEIVAATGTDSLYGSRITIYDANSGMREWQSPESGPGSGAPFMQATAVIALVPHADAAGMDIVLAGEAYYDGDVVVLDGVSKSVVMDLNGGSSQPALHSRLIRGMSVLDYDGDGVSDYVLATQPTTSDTSGAKLLVLSGVDGHLLWESVVMAGGINDVLVQPPGAPGAPSHLIAVLPASLRAYNSQTQLLDWVLAVSNDGASYVEDGIAGAEIAVYQTDGALSFYDADTRTYLRGYPLTAPVAGLLPLGGDVSKLLATIGDQATLIDGTTGNILAASTYLGSMTEGNGTAVWPRSRQPLAITRIGGSVWQVAVPSEAALWRFRLATSDTIFSDSFDSD